MLKENDKGKASKKFDYGYHHFLALVPKFKKLKEYNIKVEPNLCKK